MVTLICIQICQMLSKPGTEVVYSTEHQGIYAYNGDQWVGYDDPRSLLAKVGTSFDWNIQYLICGKTEGVDSNVFFDLF